MLDEVVTGSYQRAAHAYLEQTGGGTRDFRNAHWQKAHGPTHNPNPGPALPAPAASQPAAGGLSASPYAAPARDFRDHSQVREAREVAIIFAEWLFNNFDMPKLLNCWILHRDVVMMTYDLAACYNEFHGGKADGRWRFYETLASFKRLLEESTMRYCENNAHKDLSDPANKTQRDTYYNAWPKAPTKA